jgi:hypothetical protein
VFLRLIKFPKNILTIVKICFMNNAIFFVRDIKTMFATALDQNLIISILPLLLSLSLLGLLLQALRPSFLGHH